MTNRPRPGIGTTTDRGRASPAPAARARSCRAACRCAQPRARPKHPTGQGSSLPQNVKHALQRAPVEARTDTDAAIAADLDLDRLGSRWRWLLIGLRRDRHRHQRRRRRRRERLVDLPMPPAPCKNLVGVDVVLTRHHRHRCTRQTRRCHDLALQRLRPAFVPTPLTTCVHIRHCGHMPRQGGAHRRKTTSAHFSHMLSQACDPWVTRALPNTTKPPYGGLANLSDFNG